MGFEIWDRDDAFLLDDFDTEAQALEFLHDMVRTLDADATALTLDRMQLVRVTDEGRSTEVVAAGVELFRLMYAEVPRPR